MPERRLTLLEELRIISPGDRCWFKTQHRSRGEGAWAKLSLRHRHEPVRGENLVRTTWAALLQHVEKCHAVEHQHPLAFHCHKHRRRRGIWLCTRSRCTVMGDLLNECVRLLMHVHLRVGHFAVLHPSRAVLVLARRHLHAGHLLLVRGRLLSRRLRLLLCDGRSGEGERKDECNENCSNELHFASLLLKPTYRADAKQSVP